MPRIALLLFLFSNCLISVILLLSAHASIAATRTEWVLDQKHHDIGTSKIYITDDAIKIINLDRGFSIVAKAPTWKVVIFRTQEKVEYITDLKGFERFSVFGPVGWAQSSFRNPAPSAKEVAGDLHLSKYLKLKSGSDIWKIDDITTAREVQTLYQQYQQTAITGILYRCSSYESTIKPKAKEGDWFGSGLRGVKDWLVTRKCVKVPYNPVDFEYPHGLKDVKVQSQVLVSPDKNTDISSFLDGMGVDGQKTTGAAARVKP